MVVISNEKSEEIPFNIFIIWNAQIKILYVEGQNILNTE